MDDSAASTDNALCGCRLIETVGYLQWYCKNLLREFFVHIGIIQKSSSNLITLRSYSRPSSAIHRGILTHVHSLFNRRNNRRSLSVRTTSSANIKIPVFLTSR